RQAGARAGSAGHDARSVPVRDQAGATAAADTGLRAASAVAVRSAAATARAADSVEIHRPYRHAGPARGRLALGWEGDPSARHGRADYRRAISDREDRRGIDRDGVRQRYRTADAAVARKLE